MTDLMKERLSPYVQLARNTGANFSIKPEIILAVIWQESRGIAGSNRYEPALADRAQYYMPMSYANKLMISTPTELNSQVCSYGLMHILGSTAREMGFDGYWGELYVPANNIHFGTKYLSELMNKVASVAGAISAYNWGHQARGADGLYLNQKSYVDPVMSSLVEIRQWISS